MTTPIDAPGLAALLLGFSVLAPGALLWSRLLAPRWRTAGREPSLTEALLTALLAGLATASILALALTFLRAAFPLSLALAAFALCALLWRLSGGRRPGRSSSWPRPRRSDLGALGLLALAALVFLPPVDSYLLGSDASIYLGTSAVIQREGAPELFETWIAELPAELRQALFRSGERYAPFHRFPGGMILRQPERGRSVPSFPILFPLWAGLARHALASTGVLWLAPLLAALALLALFALLCDPLGAPWAAAAAAILALAPVQIAFARTAMPEVQLELLLLGAALCAARAAQGLGLPYRLLAVSLVGLALFSKYHAHLALLPVGLIALAELGAGLRWRPWLITYGGLALLYAFYLRHHARFPTDYPAHFEFWYASGGRPVVLAALGAALLAFPAALWLRRRAGAGAALADRLRLRRFGAAAFAALAAYNLLIRPFHPFGPAEFDQVNLIKAGWQLSHPGLLLALFGIGWMIARAQTALLPLLLVGLAFGVAFVAQGDSIPYQYWHARKLVPAVLPLAAAGVAFGARQAGAWVGRLAQRLAPRAASTPAALGAAVGAAALLGVALLQLQPDRILLGHREGAGAYAAASALAARLPGDGLSLFAPGSNVRGLHLAGFATLVAGRPAISLPNPPPEPKLLVRLQRWAERRGWALVAVAAPGRLQWLPRRRLEAEALARVRFRLPRLERPVGRLPDKVGHDSVNLALYAIRPQTPSDHERPAQGAQPPSDRGQPQSLP